MKTSAGESATVLMVTVKTILTDKIDGAVPDSA
jgi:hypothetical protein